MTAALPRRKRKRPSLHERVHVQNNKEARVGTRLIGHAGTFSILHVLAPTAAHPLIFGHAAEFKHARTFHARKFPISLLTHQGPSWVFHQGQKRNVLGSPGNVSSRKVWDIAPETLGPDGGRLVGIHRLSSPHQFASLRFIF